MAAIAGIEIWRRRKLPAMLIAVAIRSALELDFEESVFSFWDMTLGTLQACVSALQGIGAGSMILNSEFRWLPSIHGVAGRAFCTALTLGKLAVMRIRFVAVHALLEGERLFKIPAAVALDAVHRCVLA